MSALRLLKLNAKYEKMIIKILYSFYTFSFISGNKYIT